MVELSVRACLSRMLTGHKEIALESKAPSREELGRRYADIRELGLYLHIPFCRQLCPYCPYTKELYSPDVARRYTAAVKEEIDFYAGIVGDRAITSLYIGGGTPTTMLRNGLEDIVKHIDDVFDLRGDIHMESHPNDLDSETLDAVRSLGVKHLSTGVESLQDRHLRTLNRPYTAARAREAVERAVSRGFTCVNADIIFALPGQTYQEVEEAGRALVAMGVDQVAAYPLFRFPYTRMGGTRRLQNHGLTTIVKRRTMLKILERIFYGEGFERTSVWAFTRSGVPRYCSVTVPIYLGLGASGCSYLKDIFYLNTFDVSEYINAMERRGTAIALSLDLSERMQMAGWLYWRIYETRFRKSDFQMRFGKEFDRVYGTPMKFLGLLGFLHDDGDQIVLSDEGTYWLHALEDLFSIAYVSKLWGTSQREPWPERVVL